jgi:hypothetical protein
LASGFGCSFREIGKAVNRRTASTNIGGRTGRYQGIANTIVQLFRVRASDVMRSSQPMQSEMRRAQASELSSALGEDNMSHHYSGPDYGFPHGDARLDLTDLYAFPKPGDPSKSILIMNVHPSVGVNPAGPTTDEPFATEAIYELRIDTNGDLVADVAYRVRFSSDKGGGQTATVRRVEGEQAAGTGDDGQTIIEGAPVSTGLDSLVTEAGDYRFLAGWRSDPFFFDTMGALNNLQFTGDDFFADKDVCSIVLEVPNSALGSGTMGLWHRTVDGTDGKWVQADRGALASQSVFLPGDEKAAYQAGQPADDARFIAVFAHSLEHTGGYTPEEARRAAGVLLPDILPYDPSKPASYPANGRILTDDAIDVFLSILTNGKVTGDKVGPHKDLLTSFPYVGPPHKARSVNRLAA